MASKRVQDLADDVFLLPFAFLLLLGAIFTRLLFIFLCVPLWVLEVYMEGMRRRSEKPCAVARFMDRLFNKF